MTDHGEPSRVTVGYLRELLADLDDAVEVAYHVYGQEHVSTLYVPDVVVDVEGGLLLLEVDV